MTLLWAGDASGATLYVSPSGDDAAGCSVAFPCRSFNRAYQAAAPGDTVTAAFGDYGSQTVSGTKSSPGVVFDTSAAHLGNLTVHANWVEFRGGSIDGYGWWREATNPVPSHVTFRNVTAKSASFNGGDSISIVGGSIGGYVVPSAAPTGFFLEGDVNALTNFVVDGVDFHDISHAVASDHFEAIRIDQGVSNVTIKNSRFRNITANSSVIFVTNTNAEPGDPHDLVFENNSFEAPATGAGGGAYYIFNMNAVVQTCSNWAFRYNSFASSPASLLCASLSNVSWVGNVGPKAAGVCQGNTFSHNVWQWTTSATRCGSTDTWVNGPQYSASNLGFLSSTDFHLAPGSPAVDAGDGASFPSTDFEGHARPQGAAPDAGASEYGSGSPPPPPPDTTPPDTNIDAGPGAATAATTASFSFTSTESGSTFQCQLDGGSWDACSSPAAYSGLAAGGHSFGVKATDAAGNADASPATYAWTVTAPPPPPPPPPPPDTTPPDTSLTWGPPDSSTATDAIFAFTSTEAGSSFECQLDGGAWSSCAVPTTYSGLGIGSHSFGVRATDAAGNTDPSPASYGWTVTTPSPPPPPPPSPPPPTTPPPSPPVTGLLLLGDQTVESHADGMPLGQSEAFQATASATGQLAAVRVYLDGASTVARLTVGLYTDSGGQPSRRLTQGALNFPAAAGWSAVPVTATTVTAGRRYWIALLGSGGGLLRYRDRSSGSCLSRTSAQTSLRELPFAWRTARTYGDCPLSAYALATAAVKAARATPSSTRCKRRGARCPRPSKKRKRRSR